MGMELKEFRPYSHTSAAFDEQRFPWLKKVSRKNKNALREAIAQCVVNAVEDYLRTTVEQIAIKRKLNAPITEKDLKAFVAEIRLTLKRMKTFALGGKPMAFDRKNPYYRKGDEKAPFYSEAFLYCLLGKDFGRTVCYSFDRLCEIVGLEDSE